MALQCDIECPLVTYFDVLGLISNKRELKDVGRFYVAQCELSFQVCGSSVGGSFHNNADTGQFSHGVDNFTAYLASGLCVYTEYTAEEHCK